MTVVLAPSILAADFARLGEQVTQTEKAGANRIHVDVMDGHFVPNLSIGPAIVKSLRPVTKLPLECHLMIEEPDRYLEPFASAGADSILVHVEVCKDLLRTVRAIKALGKKAGVVINPPTPVPPGLEAVLPEVSLVLVMTVNPGFGGQEFIASTLPKIQAVRTLIDRVAPTVDLEVDGGIEAHTAPQAVQAGANVLVAGSSIFRHPGGVAAGMAALRASVPGMG
jgi:ribulose-phosphate 3-epimerase